MTKFAAKLLIDWTPISERIITAGFYSKHVKMTILHVYAPTENAEESVKNERKTTHNIVNLFNFVDSVHSYNTSSSSSKILFVQYSRTDTKNKSLSCRGVRI